MRGHRGRAHIRGLAGAATRALALVLAGGVQSAPAAGAPAFVRGATPIVSFAKLPLSFVANQGQFEPAVRFVAARAGLRIVLTSEGVRVAVEPKAPHGHEQAELGPVSPRSGSLALRFVGGNPRPEVAAEDELPGKVNDLVGRERTRWRTGVATYAKVRYREVFPGIDALFYGNGGRLEFDFIVAPGADPGRIAIEVEGEDAIRPGERGDLLVGAPGRELTLRAPNVFQGTAVNRREITGRYVVRGEHRVGFEVASYDASQALVIDPVVEYATYLGGSLTDAATAVAVDVEGAVYVVGLTASPDFPVRAPIHGRYPPLGMFDFPDCPDAFVTKIDPSGTSLVWSTYIGGEDDDQAMDVAVDAQGDVYVGGITSSKDFPVTATFASRLDKDHCSCFGGEYCEFPYNTFVLKLAPSGGSIVYSALLGGSGDDQGMALAVDPAGEAVIAGSSTSPDFPLAHPAQGTPGGGWDAFVSKLSPTGDALVYSTVLGGRTFEGAADVAVDASGAAYVVGTTDSPDFPVSGTIAGGSGSAFLVKLGPGGALEYSTRINGGGANGVAVDPLGRAWVTGQTSAPDFPLVRPLQPALLGSSDAFVLQVGPAGDAITFATYLGGTGGQSAGWKIAPDASGGAIVLGATSSTGFPSARPWGPACAASGDLFLARIDPAGASLAFAGCLGVGMAVRNLPIRFSGWPIGVGLAVAATGETAVAGTTVSDALPVVNPLQRLRAGREDAFVVTIRDDTLGRCSAAATATPTFGAPPLAVTFAALVSGCTAPYLYDWDFGDGSPHSGEARPAHTYAEAGNYAACLIVTGAAGETAGAGLDVTAVSLTLGASPASGHTPLTVSFESAVVGGVPPYRFDWDFGDQQGHSSLQNPTHGYTGAGTYTVALAVSDAVLHTAREEIVVTATAPCTLSCRAGGPLFAGAGTPAAFSSQVTVGPTCVGVPGAVFDFGDGTIDKHPGPDGTSHTYASAGVYRWGFTATVEDQTCSAGGEVTVSQTPTNRAWMIPALGHKPGYYGSRWRADVAVVNPNDTPARLTLAYHSDAEPAVANTVLAPHATVEWDDVQVSLFKLPDTLSSAGVVDVLSDVPVVATARSYNSSDHGSFGGGFPALPITGGLTGDAIGILPQLTRNSAFRTNVGFVNLGASPCSVALALFDVAGSLVGSTSVEIPPGRWLQIDDAFQKLDPFGGLRETRVDLGYGTVEVLTAGGHAWAYAAVVDNATGDPTIVGVSTLPRTANPLSLHVPDAAVVTVSSPALAQPTASRPAIALGQPLDAPAASPQLVFSTFVGGADNEQLAAVACDVSGNVYVAGTTIGTVYPTSAQIFVAKYSTEGSLVWSRTIDVGNILVPVSAAVTADGKLCVVGSALPPTSGPPVHRFGPGGDLDGLVVVVTPDGEVESMTYLGGSSSDEIDGVAIAPDGSIVVVGTTYSYDFPTMHPFQPRHGLGGWVDAFVAALSPDASSLVASSYLGGSQPDAASGVAVDARGAIWVVGSTGSDDLPSERAFPGTNPCGRSGGAFVAKLAPGGRSLEFSAPLCGTGGSWANAVAVDGAGNAYVVGGTYAPDFPTTPGALKTTISGSGTTDAFVTAVAAAGDRLLFSTYLGGSDGMTMPGPNCCFGREEAYGVAVDASGRVFVAGATSSADFPLVQPLQAQRGDSMVWDAFLSVLDVTGTRLEFSTYLGGAYQDSARAVALPVFGRVVVAGTTQSHDFPVLHAAQPTYGGGNSDGFVAEIGLSPAPFGVAATASPASGLAPLPVALEGVPSGGVPPYTFDWDFGDGSPHSIEQEPVHVYAFGGAYAATVKATDSGGASASASVTVSVTHHCWVACTASVPLAAGSGQAVTFSGSAVPTDCPGAATYAWDFGDGQTATQPSPSHGYGSPGLYAWSLTTTLGAASCTRSGTIVITAAPASFTALIPALAHKRGYSGSKWRADVTVVNPNDAAADLTLAYFSGSAPVLRTAALAPHATIKWSDVLVSLFGLPQDASTSGAVQVISDAPVAAIGRSYNASAGGTFGGSFPALTSADGVAPGDVGYLAALTRNAAFRSNVGFANPGTSTSTVRLRLFDAAGVKMGEETLDVAAGRWLQLDDVFNVLGAGDADLAYATVEVLTDGSRVWAYAAVIDNATGDPTIVPVIVP